MPTAAAGSAKDPIARKQRIFDTAIRLFTLKGFAATGMREIAREADVNLATINYFYGSKIGLLEAILDDFFDPFIEILRTNLVGDCAPEKKLRRAIVAAATYFAAEREKMLTIMTELHHDTPEISSKKAHWVSQVANLFKSQVFDPLSESTGKDLPIGIIGPAIPSLMASHFLFRPIVEKILPKEVIEADDARYSEVIAELYLNGLVGLIASAPPRGTA